MIIGGKKAIVWDLECFPDFFSAGFITTEGKKIVFEVSPRKDDRSKLFAFAVNHLRKKYTVVGFNSLSFDYPLFHKAFALRHLPRSHFNAELKEHSNHLIMNTERWNATIDEKKQIFSNVDLFLIHHFDNDSRSTSLKDIAFMMERDNIRDLPYDPNEPLCTSEKMDDVLSYQMDEDCEVTLEFLKQSSGMFSLREKYSKQLGINMLNFNDTKMGKKFTEEKVKEVTGDEWFFWKDGKKKKTVRPMLRFGDAILPSIQFRYDPALKAVLEFFKNFSTPTTKECFKNYPVEKMGNLGNYVINKKKVIKRKSGNFLSERVENITILFKGVPITFGTGGVHASLTTCNIVPSPDEIQQDIDVTSFYPSQITENKIYPAHVGPVFYQVYAAMKNDRVKIKHLLEKHYQEESAMLKLALNGTYGDLNNEWSVFYDPLALLKVTLNGQLQLCMLAESLAYHPVISNHFTLIQMNTDGMTFRYKKEYESIVREVISNWEKQTRMDMEYTRYSGMWIRDVNNYIARYYDPLGEIFGYAPDKNLKLKGCYEWDIYTPKKKVWHKNPSNRASAYAAVQYMTQGVPIEYTLRNYPYPYHFFIRAKVPRTNKLLLDGVNQQHISRIYISKTGGVLTKLMPPLPKSPDQWREQLFQGTGGWKVKVCNRTKEIDMTDIDFDYYIKAAQDLITPMEMKI